MRLAPMPGFSPMPGNVRTNNPLKIFGSNCIIWLTPHDADFCTLDTTSGRTSLSALINRGANGGTVTQSTKANQPTLLTSQINSYDVYDADVATRGMAGAQAISGNCYLICPLNIPAYATNFGRGFSFSSSTSSDFDANNKFIALLRNGSTSGIFSFQNNASIGTAYDFGVGSFKLTEILFDDTANQVTQTVDLVSRLSATWNGTISADTLLLNSSQSNVFTIALPTRWPELVIVNQVPSSEQRTAIRKYFNNKYNMGLSV